MELIRDSHEKTRLIAVIITNDKNSDCLKYLLLLIPQVLAMKFLEWSTVNVNEYKDYMETSTRELLIEVEILPLIKSMDSRDGVGCGWYRLTYISKMLNLSSKWCLRSLIIISISGKQRTVRFQKVALHLWQCCLQVYAVKIDIIN